MVRDSCIEWSNDQITDEVAGIVTKRFALPERDITLVPRSRFGRFVKAPWSMTPVVGRDVSVNTTISFNSTLPNQPLNGTLSTDGATNINGTLNGNGTLVVGSNNSTLVGLNNNTATVSFHKSSRHGEGNKHGRLRSRPVRLSL